MTEPRDLVAELDALPTTDPEAAHAAADDLLLSAVPQDVRNAYDRLAARCRWWAFA